MVAGPLRHAPQSPQIVDRIDVILGQGPVAKPAQMRLADIEGRVGPDRSNPNRLLDRSAVVGHDPIRRRLGVGPQRAQEIRPLLVVGAAAHVETP